MDSSPEQPSQDQAPAERMTRLRQPRQWFVLLVFSLLFAGVS
jgi:hypothetical protein